MRGRVASVAALALAAAALGGCWDRVEIQDLQVVSGVAFDAPHPGTIQVTASIILPQNLPGAGQGGMGGASAPTTALVQAEGPTVAAALQDLTQQVPGRLFWGQTRVIVFGAAFARQGIAPVVDFFLRSRTARLLTDLVATPGTGRAVLEAAPPLRVPGTDVLYEHLRRDVDVRAYVYQEAEAALTTADALLLPEVAVTSPEGGGSGGGASGGAAATSEAEPVTTLRIAGAAVLHRGRLVGWLDPTATLGAMWLNGRHHPEAVVLEVPGVGRLTLRVVRATVRWSAWAAPPGAEVRAEVRTEGVVEEVDAGHPHLEDPRVVQAVAAAWAAAIRAEVAAAVAAARRDRVDFLGLGRAVAAHAPSAWLRLRPRWPGALPRLRVDTLVAARVLGTGNLGGAP
jgi:spore germination protein KC